MRVELRGVTVENLRGYSRCSLSFYREKTLIVGRNNSGKTSVLRLLDWIFNVAAEAVLRGESEPSQGDLEFLLPARKTKHRARRLTLLVYVEDGRRRARFKCESGIAKLRINIRLTPKTQVFMGLGEPVRGERATSNPPAMELLRSLKQDTAFIYVPAFRDAGSERFRDTLLSAFRSRVAERATHRRRGGAFAEYRQVKQALSDVKTVVEDLAKPLWAEMERRLPPGLTRDAKVAVACDETDLTTWLTSKLTLQVSTGPHDSSTVPIVEVGSGLQSLLDLAIQQSGATTASKSQFIAVEEPESFLHPAAQRTAVRALFEAGSGKKVVVTTHSPIVVEEAKYGEVVLCRDQKFFEPRLSDARREEINTALLSGYGAEMMFARSVLFVEGESDRQFFEQIRRRLARRDKSGRTDELVVIPVGGKNSFAPWVQLLESYGTASDRPIQWLVLADADASSQVRQAFKAAGLQLPQDVHREFQRVQTSRSEGLEQWTAATRALNRAARRAGARLMLLPVDLEYAALNQATGSTVRLISRKVGGNSPSRSVLLRRLGSKFEGTGSASPLKSPWIRGFVGERLPWSEIPNELLLALRRWLEGAIPSRAARSLMALMEDETA